MEKIKYGQTSFIQTACYPNSCSDCETCGLLNHCKWKMIAEVIRNCVRIVAYGLKKHGLARADCLRATVVCVYVCACVHVLMLNKSDNWRQPVPHYKLEIPPHCDMLSGGHKEWGCVGGGGCPRSVPPPPPPINRCHQASRLTGFNFDI